MAVLADRVRETSTTTGTGTLTLAGALPSYRSFNATFTNGALVYYVIQSATDYEIGVGTVGTGTLARTTVLRSSNVGALVSFAAGPKDVFCSYVADRAVTTVDAATLTNKTIDDYTNFIGANQLHIKVKATATLALGTVCKAVGWNAGENAVEVAAVSSAADLALGVTDAVISIGDLGEIINTGYLEGIDTNAFAPGTILYPNTSGGFTATKPSSGTFQAVAYVLRQNVSNGTVFVEFTNPQAVEASTNTANTIVLRDGSGNFAAGTVTAALTGNASTATALQTARNINGVAFNGTADITVTAAAGTLSGSTLNSGVTASSLTSVGTLGTLTVSGNAAFDTNTLFVDATNNRVGVGTTSPSVPLEVTGNALLSGVSGFKYLYLNGSLDGTSARFAKIGKNFDSPYELGIWASTNIVGQTAATVFYRDITTESMRIDGSGNLGLGVTPSAWTASARAMQIGSVGAVYQDGSGGVEVAQNAYESAVNTYRYLISFNASRYEQQSGQHKWFTAPSGTAGAVISFTQSMTLDASGNLGVGTASPLAGYKTTIAGSSAWVTAGANFSIEPSAASGANGVDLKASFTAGGSGPIKFWTGGSQAMTLDASGNLGLGVVPSAWTDANNRGFDIGVWASVAQVGGSTMVGLNTYATTSSGGWTYKNTAAAMLYRQATSGHLWFTAPSGTAGAAISFTQAMTLDASGRLGIGTASPAAKLHINDGTGRNFIVTTDATQLGTAGIAIGGFNDTAGAYAPLSVLGSTIQFGTGLTERARIKSTGQLRFVPLAADPAGAETGDVYYNSSTNKLRVYNGAWVDLH